MIIRRQESWGELIYNTKEHRFSYEITNSKAIGIPYMTKPIVLNVDLTFNCNMNCQHCVAKDMEALLNRKGCSDLNITDDLINGINNSPFMVIVITGGEPLLPEYEKSLSILINRIVSKGIIIDTNGTIFPSKNILNILEEKDILIRVSWDIPSPKEENILRRYPKGFFKNDTEYLLKKEKLIELLIKNNINVAVQSVFHNYNYNNNNFYKFPYKLKQLGIDKWYIQRFIPSHKKKKEKPEFEDRDYENRIKKLLAICKKLNINCYFKKDKRHNSVFLLVEDGALYTQSNEKAGEKVYLGKLEEIEYFSYVSAPDHAARYMF